MIKVKNNGGKVIEVTKAAYEILYRNREGFSLYDEQQEYEQGQPEEVAEEATEIDTTENDYSSLSWGDLRGVASEKGINTKGLKREKIEELLQVGEGNE